jgi:hypothetical protein
MDAERPNPIAAVMIAAAAGRNQDAMAAWQPQHSDYALSRSSDGLIELAHEMTG